MNTLQVKKLNDLAIIPSKGSPQSAGYDLSSTEEFILMPLERKLFKTGLSFSIPSGMYGRIAPRSGLAFKNGIDVLAGVIDEDYRGEIGIILINLGKTEKEIKIGDKIAQIIFENYNNVNFDLVNDLSETIRKDSGFGSTDHFKLISNDIIPVTNRSIEISPQEKKIPLKEYESKVDIIEKWKQSAGSQNIPTNYETLIREREKNLQ